MAKIVHFEIPVDDPDRASAYVSDSEGNTIGLFQADASATAGQ